MKILWLAIAAAVAMLLAGSVYTVGENQVALRFQFGRIVTSETQSGLHFKIPLVQSVVVLDRRVVAFDVTQHRKDANIDYLVAWQISDPRRYYAATPGPVTGAEQQLTPIVVDALDNVIAQRTLQDIVALDLGSLDRDLLRQVNSVAGRSLGIQVLDIRFKRIDLPEEGNVLNSLYDRMRAEFAREASQLRAEGDEEASKIQAEADRQKLVITADAERDAQQLRGEGDAQATAIAGQAYGQDPEFYAFYRSLQSYRTMFGSKDLLVLDPDSELLRYLTNPGRASAPAN